MACHSPFAPGLDRLGHWGVTGTGYPHHQPVGASTLALARLQPLYLPSPGVPLMLDLGAT